MTAFRQGGSELSRMCRDSVSRVPEALQAQPRPVVSAAPVDVPVTPRPVRRFCDLRSIRWVSLPPRPDQQPIDDRAPPSRPARRQESRRHLDADVKERPGGGQRSSAFRRIRRCQPCHALDGQGDHPASPRDAPRARQLAGPNAARVTPIATGVAAVADTLAHRPHHDIQQTGAGHSQSFHPEGGGSQETDELGASPARRSREQRQGLALPVKIVGQPDRVTARLLPADAPGPGNRGQPPIEVTRQGADGLGRMRRTRRQDDCFHRLPRIPASKAAICRPDGGPGSAVVIRPGVRASAGRREVERLVPCAFQDPRLDDGLGPKSIQPPGGLVHQHVSAGARNSQKQQKAARSEGSGPQSHPVKPPPSSGESRLDGIPGVGGHVRRGSRPLHGRRRHSPFPDMPSSPPLVEATAQLHYPSSSWECSAAESSCRA